MRVGEIAVEVAQGDDDAFEGLALAADFLGARRVIPQRGVFAQLDQFFETAGFGLVVKDTSAAPPCAPGDPAGDWRWR
jgi:acid stress-induced BolA-like protein IbaG/YrbA